MLAEDSHPITVSLTLEDPCNGEQKLFSITLNHVQMDSGASLRLYVDTPSLQTITNLVLPASFNKTVDCGSDTSSNLPATTSTSIKNSDVEPPDVSTLANCSLPLPSTPRKHLLSETAPISSRQKRPKFNALLCSTPEALSVARKELHIDSDSDGSATEPDEEDFAHDVDHSRTTGAGPPKYLDPSHLKWYMSETIDVLQNPERSPRPYDYKSKLLVRDFINRRKNYEEFALTDLEDSKTRSYASRRAAGEETAPYVVILRGKRVVEHSSV